MTILDDLIEAGLALHREGRDDAALAHFQQLTLAFPTEGRVFFEYGGLYDYLGEEAQAIPLYRQALALGVPENLLPRLYLQLGSSLRNVGSHAEAVQLLGEAVANHPEHHALRMFYALALDSSERSHEAFLQTLYLVQRLVDPMHFDGYARAIRQYSAELIQPPSQTTPIVVEDDRDPDDDDHDDDDEIDINLSL